MKKRDFMFNGKTFELSPGLTDRLQERLNQTLPGYATLKEFKINKMDNSFTITVNRKAKDFRYQNEGEISFEDLIIFVNLPFIHSVETSHCPFSNLLNFTMATSDVKDEYNNFVRNKNKIRGLEVDAGPDSVSFTYKY